MMGPKHATPKRVSEGPVADIAEATVGGLVEVLHFRSAKTHEDQPTPFLPI